MTIIEASSVGVKTMADDTLRLTVDIEPRFAKAAFELFGVRGRPMALAALSTVQHSAREEPAPEAEPEKPKGGELAKLSAMWCAQPRFWAWCTDRFLNADPVRNETDAKELVCFLCGVKSRAELDHNPQAKALFDRQFRVPFNEYLKQTEFA